jgi:hypothetical protein
MEAICPSGIPADFHRTTRQYILEYKVFITACDPCKSTDVSEERATSIFGVEEYAKQETTVLLAAYFLLGLLFDPKDGSITLLRSVGGHIPDYMAYQLRREYISW